jgi:dipeptidyl aminopeptidase/acylaminoacyl peptidase
VEDRTRGNPADDTRPRYTPDGRSRSTEAGAPSDSDFTRLARLDRDTGKSAELAPAFDARADWALSKDGKLVYHAERGGKVSIYAVAASGGEPKVVVLGSTTGNVAATSQGALVFTRQSLTSPTELCRAEADGTGQKSLTAFDDEKMKGFDKGPVLEMTFKGASGDDVQMFVVTPPGFDPSSGKKWPFVQLIHGGPHSSWTDAFSYRWNPLLFAARGYVVALVNFHGSMGSGQKFADAIVGAHGDKPFTDIMKSTDALIARGYVDPDRMAATGAPTAVSDRDPGAHRPVQSARGARRPTT